MRCIEACPTTAIVPSEHGWTIDARRCIAYLNIELRGSIPEERRASMGAHVFGCDICQEVCPWNSRAPETGDPAFEPEHEPSPALEALAYLSESEFRVRFRNSPVSRPKYEGFMRSVAVAMGAIGLERFREPLEHLTRHPSGVVAEHARWGLSRLDTCTVPSRG